MLFNSAFYVTEYLYFVFQHKTNLFQEFISTDEYSTSLVLCGLMHGSLLCKEYSCVLFISTGFYSCWHPLPYPVEWKIDCLPHCE